MGNQHGYMCPHCGSQDDLGVIATAKYKFISDGCVPDEDDGDVEYSSDSLGGCYNCGWDGRLGQFIQVCNGESLGEDDIPEMLWFPGQGWALALVSAGSSYDEQIEVVTTDEWCDNGIELSMTAAKRLAIKAGLVFEDSEYPYKPTGFKTRREI